MRSIYWCLIALMITVPAGAQERTFNLAVHSGIAPAQPRADARGPEVGLNLGIRFGTVDWGGAGPGAGHSRDQRRGGDVSFGGAIRVIAPRKASADPRFNGLGDIDRAVELGVNLAYQSPVWRAFFEARQGVEGHEGATATIGADLLLRPSERLTLSAGPRLELGNRTFARTYYGVSGEQAAASGYRPYDPAGGILSAGITLGASYRIDERWAVEGVIRYDRLQNAAAQSPISSGGQARKWRMRVGFSRALSLRF